MRESIDILRNKFKRCVLWPWMIQFSARQILLFHPHFFIYGHTIGKAPVLVRSPKLSPIGPGQYLDGWPPGNTWCCSLNFLLILFFEFVKRSSLGIDQGKLNVLLSLVIPSLPPCHRGCTGSLHNISMLHEACLVLGYITAAGVGAFLHFAHSPFLIS